MRTKEEILKIEGLDNDAYFEWRFKCSLLEVLVDIRTNLKDIGEQLRALRVEEDGDSR